MKERNRFEGWKDEKMGEKGRRATVCEQYLDLSSRRKSKYFVTFGERRKRKEFGNFVVEARVDELCSSPLKMVAKMNIYRGRDK